MTRIRSRSLGRRGFTLIELLVVIAIIAILVSLTAAGVMKVLWKIPEIQTSTEISQLGTSLAAFQSDYQCDDPPPSFLILKEDLQYNLASPVEARSAAFLRRVFGKNLGAGTASAATGGLPFVDWNGDGIFEPTTLQFNGWTLEGEQCLIFYTGGIPSVVGSTPQPLGFSTNNNNPAMPGGKRNGPYMDFKVSRLVQNQASGFYVYIDAWQSKTSPSFALLGGSPYAYFSSYGINNSYNPFTAPSPTGVPIAGDCRSISAFAYAAGTTFTAPNRYQIISAGADGTFGFDAGPPATIATSITTGFTTWNPSSGAVGNGKDDQASFSSKILGAGQY